MGNPSPCSAASRRSLFVPGFPWAALSCSGFITLVWVGKHRRAAGSCSGFWQGFDPYQPLAFEWSPSPSAWGASHQAHSCALYVQCTLLPAEPLTAVEWEGWGSTSGIAPGAEIQVHLPLLTETSPLLLANQFLCFLTLHAVFVARASAAEGVRRAVGCCDRDKGLCSVLHEEARAGGSTALCRVPSNTFLLALLPAERCSSFPLPLPHCPCTQYLCICVVKPFPLAGWPVLAPQPRRAPASCSPELPGQAASECRCPWALVLCTGPCSAQGHAAQACGSLPWSGPSLSGQRHFRSRRRWRLNVPLLPAPCPALPALSAEPGCWRAPRALWGQRDQDLVLGPSSSPARPLPPAGL